ncbi:MAG TPA: hypothetical protein VE967_15990 [Gemmatimonadaceae bacterium]|nr:hypothetical protein [Gemmatimonadaceae bacterium]
MRDLARIVRALHKAHGSAGDPPVRDPFRLILWEQVAYLADDGTRLAAWRILEKDAGTSPDEIMAAPLAAIRNATRAGGKIAYEMRAKRIKFVAERVANLWDGDLTPVLALPFDRARRELMKYPSIGKPGAERILVLAGAYAPLALDSNGLRVLLRLGYGKDRGRYDKTYDDVQAAAAKDLPETVTVRRTAHLVLRAHGQTICRRSTPLCAQCVVRALCPVGRAI